MGPTEAGPDDQALHELFGSTRLGVVERLADPYLTSHDRWVLRQFAMFLSGVAPEPDLRGLRVTERKLPVRPRLGFRHR